MRHIKVREEKLNLEKYTNPYNAIIYRSNIFNNVFPPYMGNLSCWICNLVSDQNFGFMKSSIDISKLNTQRVLAQTKGYDFSNFQIAHSHINMTDYADEQRNELEAIESIYPDSFTGSTCIF